MIIGTHAILFSTDAQADREVLAELLRDRHAVDAGEGWLVLALPPAEVAVHPTDGPPQHELYLMCDDIEATVADLEARGVRTEGGLSDQGWGILTSIHLPSGARIGLYQPRHPIAANVTAH